MMLRHVISLRLNVAKKIAALEIMILNCEKMQHVLKLKELMSKGKLHCFQECFSKQTGRENV